jgi:hypothetical protein
MEATYTSGLAKSLLKIIIPLVKHQYFYKVLCQDFFRAFFVHFCSFDLYNLMPL